MIEQRDQRPFQSDPTRQSRCRVLFVSEDVTLAQVVRLVTLAKSLDPSSYDVHFACGGFDDLAFRGCSFARHPITTLDRPTCQRALLSGERLYETSRLVSYVEEELGLFESVRPDAVVGDFRLSLAVSCPLSKIPLITLANAYWSPFAARDRFPVPDHPLVDRVGVEIAQRFFPIAMGSVFKHFAKPVNDTRKRFGLRRIGDLPDVLTWGDFTLYADPPGLVPMRTLPANHRFLGPVHWSPPVALPDFFGTLDRSKPLAYVTLGSSGRLDRLPVVLQGLRNAGVLCIVSTAGRPAEVLSLTPYLTDFLPGDLVARQCALVVSNGGSSTGYQALAEGVPVLGIASNMDQHLAMTAIENAGAGILVRSSTVTASDVRSSAERLLADASFAASARKQADAIARCNPTEEFRRILAVATSFSPSSALSDLG